MQPLRTRKRRKLKAEINVVPYIDVMLVLLIIFMVTAPLLNLGVDIHLPQSAAKALHDQKQPVLVTVTKDGSLYLTLSGGKREAISDQDLETRVAAFV
ncbi:MAG TPA: biopolymer transporter ExbD, partial [Rhodanobacteraceae bacterium]